MERQNSYRWFVNRDCEYFPCHRGADPENFGCLFCYCPLYPLGERCGGQFCYTPEGIKDCSGCLLPHSPRGYDYIVTRFPDILKLMEGQKSEK